MQVPFIVRLLLAILVIATSSGCSLLRSRYAMDDPIYAEKYADGASKRDVLGKIKQAVDARHTEYLQGWHASGGVRVRPDSGTTFGSIDIGHELYQKNYFTTRISLAGLAGDGGGSLGVDVGARWQTPTRLAPFVGVGGSVGVLLQDAVPLLIDTATDVDLFNDEESEIDGFAAVYPEAGVHFWFNGHTRLTAFGRYAISTDGRESDNWLVGGQVALFTR